MRKWHAILGAITLALLTFPAAAAVVTTLAPDDGQLLLGQLNCVACHAATDSAAQRTMPQASPSLANAGERMTPQFLRAIFANPQKAKPGTAMPDVLHALPADQRPAAI